MTPRLYIARTPDGSDFPLPSYASQYHIGLLLRAAIGSTLKINAGERIRIPVGFVIGVPQGFCGQIVSTPSLAETHGLVVSDSPHILNPADREPIFVLLQNVSSNPHVLHRGDVIAELLIIPAVQVCWNEVKAGKSSEKTDITREILDPGAANNEQSNRNLFFSARREKKSARHRFQKPNEEE